MFIFQLTDSAIFTFSCMFVHVYVEKIAANLPSETVISIICLTAFTSDGTMVDFGNALGVESADEQMRFDRLFMLRGVDGVSVAAAPMIAFIFLAAVSSVAFLIADFSRFRLALFGTTAFVHGTVDGVVKSIKYIEFLMRPVGVDVVGDLKMAKDIDRLGLDSLDLMALDGVNTTFGVGNVKLGLYTVDSRFE